jgi:hypothetical protein
MCRTCAGSRTHSGTIAAKDQTIKLEKKVLHNLWTIVMGIGFDNFCSSASKNIFIFKIPTFVFHKIPQQLTSKILHKAGGKKMGTTSPHITYQSSFLLITVRQMTFVAHNVG